MSNITTGTAPSAAHIPQNNPIAPGAQRPRRVRAPARKQAKQKAKAKKEEKQEARVKRNPKCEMTKECYQKHLAAASYLYACGHPQVRGQLSLNTENPVASPYAVAFTGEASWKDTAGPGVTVTFGFPLGFQSPTVAAPMDGEAYHSEYQTVGASPFSTGVFNSIDSTGTIRAGIASWRHAVAGVDAFPVDTATGIMSVQGWDRVFSLQADTRASTQNHLRGALISASIEFYVDTPMGSRGGYFQYFEPRDVRLPMAASANNISGTQVRELPTFRLYPADDKLHRVVVRGKPMSRAYWHNTSLAAGAPSVLTDSKNAGAYLQFVNTTGVVQSFGWRILTQWSISGNNIEGFGEVAPEVGMLAPLVTNALQSANSGTTPVTKMAESAVGNVVVPVARSMLNGAIKAASGAAGLSAFSPVNLTKMFADAV